MRRAHVLFGFTLIELLVVVAIISLLIGISVPAVGRARLISRRVKCMAQLREIGHGVQMYLNEYRDTFPHCAQKPTNEPEAAANDVNGPRPMYVPIYHADAFGQFLTQQHRDPSPRGGFQDPDEYLAYVQNHERHELFHCPADRGQTSGDPEPGYQPRTPFFQIEGTSYEWNPHRNGQKVLRPDPDALVTPKESDTWLIRDFDCFHVHDSDLSRLSTRPSPPGSLDVLYADLHVQAE
jgi:prepilin-type N-terminal cleavage/methylation domain-containing protein